MGKRQRDCAECGASVGIIGRDLCSRCVQRQRDAATKSTCPGCGRQRVLQADSGQCIRCSRRCSVCSAPVRSADATLCKRCVRAEAARAAKRPCSRCGRPGFLREATGWCGSCSRPGPPKQPPRVCRECGQLRRHAALGLCSPCYQRQPDRTLTRAENLIASLPDPPDWLLDFAVHVSTRFNAGRASGLVSELARLLQDGQSQHAQALLERSRRPGRSMGSLARALEDFFTTGRLALPTDQTERLAAGRRQRRIDQAPETLRAGVASFAEHLLRARRRALRAGTRPRSDSTIETALAITRDLARFLASQRGKNDWAVVDVHDIEAFLATAPKARHRRLTVLRQFFRFAYRTRLILIDPTTSLKAKQHNAFRGRTLNLNQQRQLFRRLTSDDPDVHPHEALVGMLALLHAASSQEARLLRLDDIDHTRCSARLGERPHPVPLDPATWAVLLRCLDHRVGLNTANPHVIVTKGTKAGRKPASTAYLSHVLDPCGHPPRAIRSTRLVDLVNTLDPKLVAAALGLDPQAPLIYLADRIDPDLLEGLGAETPSTANSRYGQRDPQTAT